MNRAEFMKMHEDCVTAMRAYFAEADKMCAMLMECSEGPMTVKTRLG
jgi:frataxin-like iron-binding protein CyaY